MSVAIDGKMGSDRRTKERGDLNWRGEARRVTNLEPMSERVCSG